MKYVEVVADPGSADSIAAIAETLKASDFRLGEIGKDGMQLMRLLVVDDKIQLTLDSLQKILGAQPASRIVVLPVEIALPKPSQDELKVEGSAIESREALYAGVEKIRD